MHFIVPGMPSVWSGLAYYALMIYKLQIFCIYKLLRRGVHCLQMKALKDLGLDVTKGSVATDSSVTQTKFHIMRLWVHATFCLLQFLIPRLVVCLHFEK